MRSSHGEYVAIFFGIFSFNILSYIQRKIFFSGEAFDYLDAPVYRVTGADIPTPYAVNLEVNSLPQSHNVVRTVKKVLGVE